MGKKRKAGEGKKPEWLMTYADMVTLLFTFFVLLFSMSSMDSNTISRISMGDSGFSFPSPLSGDAPLTRAKQVDSLLKDKGEIQHNLATIKSLLFPEAEHPLEINEEEWEGNIEILESDDGVVIVLSGGILFKPGSAALGTGARKLLGSLSPVIQHIPLDINISGYTAASEIPRTPGVADELSAKRAYAVLELFLADGQQPVRFSLSGYGADRPRYAKRASEEKNRRVEILLKVNRRVGDYS